MAGARFYHTATLPWSPAPEEERRLRRVMAVALGVSLLFGAIIPWIKAPERTAPTAELPARFAKLLVEAPPPPPPPPPRREEPAPPESAAPEPAAAPPKPAAPVQPQTPPQPSARVRAAHQGLLALSDQLAALRAASLTPELERQVLRQPASAQPPAPTTERSVITSQVASGSGGINVSRLSRDTGGTELAARQTTRVEAPAGDAPGGGPGGTGSGAAPAPRSALGQRTLEEIQRVFDANRGALNTLYNRALRDNPSLAGKVVLRLTILPSGDIGELEIVSSELRDAELERRLLARIRLFRFGAKNVPLATLTYPIDFFPG